MVRAFFAILLLLHGLIHFMGFARAFGYGNITQLTQAIPRSAGVLWFVAAVLFLIAFALYLLHKEWWLVGIPAALLSQVLILLVWQDAKFGTIANVLVVVVGLIHYADWNFGKKVAAEVTAMLAQPVETGKTVTPEQIAALPPVVQKWLLQSGVVGKEVMHTVRLRQKGTMRTKPEGNWMPFQAVQYFTVAEPAFNWQTKVQVLPGVFLSGRDKYENGQGEMLIKLLSVKEVVNAGRTGPLNQGTLLRFLSETCWFPTAALSSYITWEAVDSSSARATMSYGGVTASGVFFFNDMGDFKAFEAMRYGDFGGKASLEKWRIDTRDHRVFEGIRVPSNCEVTWKLASGDFTWLKLELTDVQYNKAERYPTLF